MTATWLRSNRRALMFGMLVPALLMAAGLVLLTTAAGGEVRVWIGWGMLLVGGLLLMLLARQCRQPRLAYGDRHLHVYLRGSQPVRVPVDIVEAFFLGRGPALLPGEGNKPSQSMNLIIRLAEKATAWHQAPVKPALGIWCDGYITVRGTWCEPLDVELVHRLNAQLADAKRGLRNPEQPEEVHADTASRTT